MEHSIPQLDDIHSSPCRVLHLDRASEDWLVYWLTDWLIVLHWLIDWFISHQAWSIAYHSWMTFVLLFGCLVSSGSCPQKRAVCQCLSPVIVIYGSGSHHPPVHLRLPGWPTQSYRWTRGPAEEDIRWKDIGMAKLEVSGRPTRHQGVKEGIICHNFTLNYLLHSPFFTCKVICIYSK